MVTITNNNQFLKSAVRTELRRVLGITKNITGNAKWSLTHCANLLAKSGMHKDLEALVAAWKESDGRADSLSDADKITQFYYWIKRNPITHNDLLVFEAYRIVAEDYIEVATLSVIGFSGQGEKLIKKITILLAGAGNDLDQCIVDYFEAHCGAVKRWGKLHLLHKTRIAFGDFAWSSYMEVIDSEHGGIHNYREANKVEQQEAQRVHSVLDQITAFRTTALNDENVSLYDQLGAVGDNLVRAQQLMEENGYV